MTVRASVILRSALLLAGFGLTACGEAQTTVKTAEQAAPPRVSVVTLQPAPRPYVRELPGRIAPIRIAEVRARVAGIVVDRAFKQGADVQPGEVLYRLDPKPYEVELEAAKAALAKAEAVFEQSEKQAKRIEELLVGRAASQVQYETAVATFRQAQAEVAAKQAEVARAELNLGYASIRSPIKGRVGRALVTEGALVGQGEATHLATVQQIDSVYADFTQSVEELQQLRRDFESGALEQVAPDAAKVRLELGDGTIYPHPGKLLFSDVTVDPSTGQVTLRGEFPNPKGELLPGMYVRVQIEQGIDGDSLAVPQQAVQRDDSGDSRLFLVRDDNRAHPKPVRVGRVVDDLWLVLDGVSPGDRVIVEGFQKFVPGDVVDPVPWQTRKQRRASAEPSATDSAEPEETGSVVR
ncbi:efflux RND transporter periplasmic adaptor subunit [Rhodoplanes roseus]|uniref:Efflux transporter periplasmic adaptor subunit n=1 Tax=Rhodoplanes roseus TaxID=29409 RepID=A0A327KZD0_9BRAD|nr:efflux RND transporter periplasmic adaptor subunit [Rhodoplanes roseus]RAI44240.1 efflux transporter periplasmic adaptor subunit [Rhodoplanes roseus]